MAPAEPDVEHDAGTGRGRPRRTTVDDGLLDDDALSRVEERFARHLNRGQRDYLRAGHLDVIEGRRSGIGFVDPRTGRRYIDCFTSAGCFNLGRRDPDVVAAVERAVDDGLDVGTVFLPSPDRVRLAERLVELAPGDLDSVRFSAGGGEAIDAALRMARGATGRPQIVAMERGYHGHVGLALSANGKAHYRRPFEPLAPGFAFVPLNDLAALEAVVSPNTAAVIIEPVQGEAGIHVADDDYLRAVRDLCDRIGALLILDEIQTGFGRTGRLFAAEHSGVVPDVMTVAKSLGGSLYPVAATLYRGEGPIGPYLASRPWFSRSAVAGSDIGCRVAVTVLDEMVARRLWENAEEQGRRLLDALRRLREEYPRIIVDVRGRGLMVGVEYVHEFMGPFMSDALSRRGVFAAYSGNAPQVMRFMPPLGITEGEMDEVIDAVGSAVASVHRLSSLALPATAVPGVLDLLNDESVQTRLFGLSREVEDMGQEMKDRARGLNESARGLIETMEPKLQQLVAAMLRAGQKVDEAAGPVVRPHYHRVKSAASSAAGQAAEAAGGAGRKVGESLPSTVKEVGYSAGAAARGAVAKAPEVARSAGPAAREAVKRAPDTASRTAAAAQEGARKAADATVKAAGKARESLPQTREEAADLDRWGSVAGTVAGKAMDAIAAGADAAARGVEGARKAVGGRGQGGSPARQTTPPSDKESGAGS